MLPAVAYTLADFLSSGLPAINTESIRFEHPSFTSTGYPSINLYLCDIRRSRHTPTTSTAISALDRVQGLDRHRQLAQPTRLAAWFNVSFLLTVQEHTHLAQERLLTATMNHCLQYPYLSRHQLAPTLRGYGRLPLRVIPAKMDIWESLEVPQQPGLQLILAVPFDAMRLALPMMA